jgi:tetratricopeptide (TPR) repeat protein
MNCRLYILLLLLATSACVSAQDETGGTTQPVDTLAIRLNNEAVEAMSEVFTPRTPADTAVYREAIAQFHRPYRIDTTYTLALSHAAIAHGRIGELDSAIVLLERGMDEEPGFAEVVGYYRMHQGQPEEAQRAFEYTLEAVESARQEALSTLTGPEREVFAGGLIRLRWLAEGREAALATLAELDPSLQQSPQVRYAACLARRADKGAYAATYVESTEAAPSGAPPPHEECAELL